jgi:ABC-type sugar transport system permease subunit
MLEKFEQMKKIKLAFAQWNLAESKTEFENQKRFVENYKKIDFKKFSESDLDKAFAAQNKVVSANLPTRDIFWAKNGMTIIMIIVAVIAGIFLAVLFINCMCGNCKSSKSSENDAVYEDGDADETSRLEHGEYKQFAYNSV